MLDQSNNYLTLQEIHQSLLDMLLSIDSFCRGKGLHYSLGGGTLLGAIRHKGFIPWDDDVDIMMPRPDYDVFVREYNSFHSIYKAIEFELGEDVRYAIGFAKVHDPRTICDAEGSDGICRIGVNVDVFPIDGMPSSEILCNLHMKVANLFRMQLVRRQWELSYPKTVKDIINTLLSRICKERMWFRMMNQTLSLYPYSKSKYAGAVTGRYGMKERYARYVFDNFTDAEFEGKQLMIIKEYDAYLTQHYGDYMIIPDSSKRESHSYYAYWK